jgi:hypothetical protein
MTGRVPAPLGSSISGEVRAVPSRKVPAKASPRQAGRLVTALDFTRSAAKPVNCSAARLNIVIRAVPSMATTPLSIVATML